MFDRWSWRVHMETMNWFFAGLKINYDSDEQKYKNKIKMLLLFFAYFVMLFYLFFVVVFSSTKALCLFLLMSLFMFRNLFCINSCCSFVANDTAQSKRRKKKETNQNVEYCSELKWREEEKEELKPFTRIHSDRQHKLCVRLKNSKNIVIRTWKLCNTKVVRQNEFVTGVTKETKYARNVCNSLSLTEHTKAIIHCLLNNLQFVRSRLHFHCFSINDEKNYFFLHFEFFSISLGKFVCVCVCALNCANILQTLDIQRTFTIEKFRNWSPERSEEKNMKWNE